MKTTEDFIKELEGNNVLTSSEFTFHEYAAQINEFQSIVCKMIAGDAYHEGMRIDEALFIMESTARQKGVRSNPAVHNGVLAMKQLSKEMAITMSGIKGEEIVSRTLEHLDRPNSQIYKNVYVADEQEETELDDIVLTDAGIIILEIKKVKNDLSLAEDGRMVLPAPSVTIKFLLAKVWH